MAAERNEPEPSGLEDYLGRPVVIDTRSTYVILGRLTAIAEPGSSDSRSVGNRSLSRARFS